MNFHRLLDNVMSDEGFRSAPYRDSVGVWTYGYGSTVADDGGPVRPSTSPITEFDAMRMLSGRLYQSCLDAETFFPSLDMLSSRRQEVVAAMAYQLGLGNLQKFVHFAAALSACNWSAAADSIRKSLWYRQTTARAERAAKAIEVG